MVWKIWKTVLFISFLANSWAVQVVTQLMLHRTSQEWWEVDKYDDRNNPNITNQTLFIRRQELDPRKFHSCYEYRQFKNDGDLLQANTFCYPSVVVTGYRKCSTSALYALLTQYPGVRQAGESKENCPYVSGRGLVQYFDTLPRDIGPDDVIVDGCIDLGDNLTMQRILRSPNTFYLVIIRDFADWLWSAYNFWCDPQHDQFCDPLTAWVVPGVHLRSPLQFHHMVEDTAEKDVVKLPNMQNVCYTADNHFTVFVHTLWKYVSPENTLVIASEQLDAHPAETWERLARAVGLDRKHPKIEEFTQVRYNTNNDKGEGSKAMKSVVLPGRYAASNYTQMFDETRNTLNACWYRDCIFASLITGHNYSSCNEHLDDMSAKSQSVLQKARLQASQGYTKTYVTSRDKNKDITTSFLLRGYEKCRMQPPLRALRQRVVKKRERQLLTTGGSETTAAGGENNMRRVVKVKTSDNKTVYYCRPFSGGSLDVDNL